MSPPPPALSLFLLSHAKLLVPPAFAVFPFAHTTPTKSDDDGAAPASQLCARQMAADGCLDAHGAPEGGAHKCGECATAHNKDLLARAHTKSQLMLLTWVMLCLSQHLR